jgi:Family of unknown function (DUF6152)
MRMRQGKIGKIMNRRSVIVCLAAGSGLWTIAGPARAHHSFAMFDREKKVTLVGVVKDFQWTNPHSWIQVLVSDADGEATEWSIECGSPNMMARQGWKSSTLKLGDKVALIIYPMRDGSKAGSLMSITLVDGTVLGPGGAPAPETGNAPPPT